MWGREAEERNFNNDDDNENCVKPKPDTNLSFRNRLGSNVNF